MRRGSSVETDARLRYIAPIAALGARRVADLAHINDEDLDDMGMGPDERANVRITLNG